MTGVFTYAKEEKRKEKGKKSSVHGKIQIYILFQAADCEAFSDVVF